MYRTIRSGEKGMAVMAVTIGLAALTTLVLYLQSQQVNQQIQTAKVLRGKAQAYRFVNSLVTAVQAFIRSGHLIANENTSGGPIVMLTDDQREQNKERTCGSEDLRHRPQTINKRYWEFHPKQSGTNQHFVFNYCKADDWTLGNCERFDVRVRVDFLPTYIDAAGERRVNALVRVTYLDLLDGEDLEVRKKIALKIPLAEPVVQKQSCQMWVWTRGPGASWKGPISGPNNWDGIVVIIGGRHVETARYQPCNRCYHGNPNCAGEPWYRCDLAKKTLPRNFTDAETQFELAVLPKINAKIGLLEQSVQMPAGVNARSDYTKGVARCNRNLDGHFNEAAYQSGIGGPDEYKSLKFCLVLSPLDEAKVEGQIHEFGDVLVEVRFDLMDQSVTLVNIELEEQPLVLVNQQFCDLTGYSRDEVLGRNCRFLQGEKSDPQDVAYIRRSIAAGRAIYCDLLNYREDGAIFYNRLVLLPVNLDGQRHYLGMQIDATKNAQQLETKSHLEFDEFKTSEYIKDRIKNP